MPRYEFNRTKSPICSLGPGFSFIANASITFDRYRRIWGNQTLSRKRANPDWLTNSGHEKTPGGDCCGGFSWGSSLFDYYRLPTTATSISSLAESTVKVNPSVIAIANGSCYYSTMPVCAGQG